MLSTQIQEILAVLSGVLSAIGSATGLDLTKTSSLLAKIATVISLLSNNGAPTSISADVADLSQLLTGLKLSGAIPDSSPLDVAIQTLDKYTATVTDFKDGQFAIIVSNFVFEGVPGKLLAVANGGAADQIVSNGVSSS